MTLTTPVPRVTTDLIAHADALLLDFNGTLSDDEQLLAELVTEIAESELGLEVTPARYFAEFAGFTEEHMFGVLAAESDRGAADSTPLLHRFNDRYIERTAAHSTISTAAREFLQAASAAGKRLAVVTAASQDIVLPALHQSGLLAHFECVVALEDVAASKPEPECYLRALSNLGVAAENAVAFEDSRTGIAASSAAGIATVAVLGSLGEAELRALTPHVVPELDPELIR